MSQRRFDYETTDSTSERAFESLARGTARHRDLHVARAQSAGRGTRGRNWFSPPGEGLYLSLVWLPPPPPLNPAALTMAAGLAVLDGCTELGLEHARLKWPNDVVVGEAKLAGVLVETRGLEAARPHYVIGVGVNVRQRSFPAELLARRSMTSLLQCGVDRTVEDVLQAILAPLDRRFVEAARDHRRLERDFLDAIGLRGADVLVRVGEREFSGTLLDLSLSSGLTLGACAKPDRSPAAESGHVLALENVRELRRRTARHEIET